MGVEITGLQEFKDKLAGLAESLYDGEKQKLFTEAAKAIALAARHNAPKSKTPKLWQPKSLNKFGAKKFKVWHVPGTLRKAIVSKGFKGVDAIRRYGPGAWAHVNLKPNYLRTAPYGHIVETGRKSFRPFPGRFYWRRAVEGTGRVELNRITVAYKRMIDARSK